MRFVATVVMSITAAAAFSLGTQTAYAAETTKKGEEVITVAEMRSVGPFYTWESCDSERRTYSRYYTRIEQCELRYNGFWYFRYDSAS
jgi:hypothetical protein